MSFYATIAGYLHYPHRAALEAALARLRRGGWLNERNVFVTETGQPMTRETTVRDLTLEIPQGLYRNLAGLVLDEIAAGTRHRLAWTSTDGMFAGGIIVDGQETTYDLEEWGREHVGPQEEGQADEEYWAEIEWEFFQQFWVRVC